MKSSTDCLVTIGDHIPNRTAKNKQRTYKEREMKRENK
jgi:hypothetical protein